MSKFSELMKQPLPSAQKAAEEAVNDTISESVDAEVDENTEPEVDVTEGATEDNSEENSENLLENAEAELDAIIGDLVSEGCEGGECSEDGCEGDECEDDVEIVAPLSPQSAIANVSTSITDEVDSEPLSPAESQRVDDVINTVATPILINGELTESEIEEFVNSMDSDIAVTEGFLMERTIVKFDKNAKKAQLYEVAVAAVAREKKDPLFKKLNTVYKMERILKAKLRKKYHAQAQQKVKEYLARARKSKSGILSRIANKILGR